MPLLIQTACDISWGHVKGLNSSSQRVQQSTCRGVLSLLYTQICDRDLGLVLKFVLTKESAAIPGFTFCQFVTLAFESAVHFVGLRGSQFICRTILLSENRRMMGVKRSALFWG
jgi:hypothetical protein